MCPAAAGCGGVRETRHDAGDGAELEGLPAQQETNAEGGSHDGKAGEAAETGAGEETQTETSGKSPVCGFQAFAQFQLYTFLFFSFCTNHNMLNKVSSIKVCVLVFRNI